VLRTELEDLEPQEEHSLTVYFGTNLCPGSV
jgi:hypothetical protein